MPQGYAFDGQMTLGQLMDALEESQQDIPVRFAVGYISPVGLHSYRGYYEDIAIGYGEPGWIVRDLLQAFGSALHREFYGWKGGNYRMTRETPVWVSNSSEASGTAVTGVKVGEYVTILETGLVDT